MKTQFAIVASIAAIFNSASGVAPVLGVSKTSSRIPQGTTYIDSQHPVAVQRQRKSVASVQTMGLFGLGAPEIAVILVAGAFLLGPQKLAELGKEAGKMAGELKEVPKEFQEGLAEGEKQAQQMKKELRLDSKVEDAEKE
jgi:sec-independent protein translocase protein TatA